MNFIEYTPLALRTVKPHEHKQQMVHALLGLITEVGELTDSVKRHVVYLKPLDKVNLVEEVGDIFWYLNLYMTEARLASVLVDVVVGSMDAEVVKAAVECVQQPWKLAESVIMLSAIVGGLCVPEDERGVSDREVVETIVAVLCLFIAVADSDLNTVLTKNIDKLALRYGDKYTDYKALNRDVAAEQVLLGKSDAAAS